jgi:excisionase family DNA binding protein
MDDEGLTISEASAAIGVSERTIRRWIKAGRLPAALQPGPRGQQYVIPTDAIERERAADPPARTSVVDIQTLTRALADQMRDEFREQLDIAVESLNVQLSQRLQSIEQQLVELRAEFAALQDAIEKRTE